MKFPRLLLIALALVVAWLPLHADDTLRVMTYNALNFRGEQDADRIQAFRMIMAHVHPDVVAMQEIISEDAVDYLLSFAFLQNDDDWAAAPFTNDNGGDTDNALFFRTTKVQLVAQSNFDTDPRDVDAFELRPLSPDTSLRVRIYSCHLKAGDTANDATRRAGAAQDIRQHLDQLAAGDLFFLVGDFNLYTAGEEAYGLLLSESPEPEGRLFDPIDAYGNWHNSPSFAPVHTQSPRGGSYGGMDDRFDFLLASAGLMDTAGTHIIPSTYRPIGNDGLHFNQAVNDGVNYAVPDSIADALFTASDHLPVAVDVLLRAAGASVVDRPLPCEFELLSCYPNPFNSSLTIQIADLHGPATLSVLDVLGRSIYMQPVTGQTVHLGFSAQTTGTYFIRLTSPTATATQKVLLVR